MTPADLRRVAVEATPFALLSATAQRKAPPDALIEEGIGLIARGIYRLQQQSGDKVAAEEMQRVISHLRGTWMDLMRNAALNLKDKAHERAPGI